MMIIHKWDDNLSFIVWFGSQTSCRGAQPRVARTWNFLTIKQAKDQVHFFKVTKLWTILSFRRTELYISVWKSHHDLRKKSSASSWIEFSIHASHSHRLIYFYFLVMTFFKLLFLPTGMSWIATSVRLSCMFVPILWTVRYRPHAFQFVPDMNHCSLQLLPSSRILLALLPTTASWPIK